MTTDTFVLGVVVVSVTTRDGQTQMEDWDPKDHELAKEYAGEVAFYDDVSYVRFENLQSGEDVVFVGDKEVPYSEWNEPARKGSS